MSVLTDTTGHCFRFPDNSAPDNSDRTIRTEQFFAAQIRDGTSPSPKVYTVETNINLTPHYISGIKKSWAYRYETYIDLNEMPIS